jgi:hypothetical protein
VVLKRLYHIGVTGVHPPSMKDWHSSEFFLLDTASIDSHRRKLASLIELGGMASWREHGFV